MSVAHATPPALDERLASEEARLARAAAAGDGAAFADLYERYESRAFNLAYRLTGSRDDAADATQDAFLNVMRRLPKLGERELVFGSYLLTATRNAAYDLIAKRRRAEPSDSIPESAAPVGATLGGAPDPGDPGDDPDRNVLLESQQEEIREANARLPERQREALALFELEEMTYDEVAEAMEMNRNSVAQLISRARIRLRDELRGTTLASVAAATPDCERALPLIALDDDGQLDRASGDGLWLHQHMAGCETCRLSLAAMQEAGHSYRAWVPVAAGPFLMRETMAKAAELTGSDWSGVIDERSGARDAALAGGGAAGGSGPISRALASGHRRRDALIAVGLAGVLLIAGFERALDDGPPPLDGVPAAEVEALTLPAAAKGPRKQSRAQGKREQGADAGPASAPFGGDPQAPADSAPGGAPANPAAPTAPPDDPTPTARRRRSPSAAPDPPADAPTPTPSPPPPIIPPPPVVEQPPPPTAPPPAPPPVRPPGTDPGCVDPTGRPC